MESKTLKNIMTLAKIGKVLSKIVFICCIIGAAGCIVGMICVSAVGSASFLIEGKSLPDLISKYTDGTIITAYAGMTIGLIACLGEIFLAKKAELYFKGLLEDGTPFTFKGANKLKQLGIFAIAVPIVTSIVSGIAYAIYALASRSLPDMDFDAGGNIALGIMFIVMSLVCRYGAEKDSATM